VPELPLQRDIEGSQKRVRRDREIFVISGISKVNSRVAPGRATGNA
jgi:hypothetical protein